MLRYEGAVAMIADARERAKGEVAGVGFAVGDDLRAGGGP